MTNKCEGVVRYTPENIANLGENEIFVFGSNRRGEHIGGAARVAKERFGAQEGVSEGLTGRSYAFPTLDERFEKVATIDFVLSMALFLECVYQNPHLTFYLTKVGCGIAGWEISEVRHIFNMCLGMMFDGVVPKNLIIPKEFE